MDKGAWVYVSRTASEESSEPALIIDDNCLIARHCQIAVRNCIHFERNVILSASVLVTDHLHAYKDVTRSIREQGVTEGGRIRIEEGCWIGHGAAIICDTGQLVIGRNCVVSANALVTRSFPPYSVIAGNPARIVKQYDFEKRAWVMGVAHCHAERQTEDQYV